MPDFTDRITIADQYDTRSPNPFYVAIERELQEAFGTSIGSENNSVEALYVTSRFSGYSNAAKDQLFSRMPHDVRRYATDIGAYTNDPRVGVVEADLIDFLIHSPEVRLLWLVGPVGMGKSTFLHYILRVLPKHCESLTKFFPLFIDCAAVGNNNPQYIDLLERLVAGTIEMLEATTWDPTQKTEAEQLLETVSSADLQNHSANFLNLLKLIRSSLSNKQVIVIFDNLDHLESVAVDRICALARGVYLVLGLTTIVSMRPSTSRNVAEGLREHGSFSRYQIDLPSPDLTPYLGARLTYAFRNLASVEMTTSQGARLIFNPNDAKDTLLQNLFDERIKRSLLEGLANFSLRLVNTAFLQFMSFRFLDYETLLATKFVEEEKTNPQINADRKTPFVGRFRFDYLVRALMLNSRRFYSAQHSPIANILTCRDKGNLPDFTIKFRILAHLNRAQKLESQKELNNYLKTIGHSRNAISEALSYLLTKRLLVSPETENRIEDAKNVQISVSGQFYLQELLTNPTYLLNAVIDVPLPHRAYKEYNRINHRVRLLSTQEYLHDVYLQEHRQILTTLANQDRLLHRLTREGILSIRLLNAIEQVLQNDTKSYQEDIRKEASENILAFQATTLNIRRLTESIQSSLPDNTGATAFSGEQHASSRCTLVPLSEDNVSINAPSTLSPISQNTVIINAELDLARGDCLVAYWSPERSGRHRREIALLERSEGSNDFSGSFNIVDVESDEPFPDSILSLFDGPTHVGACKLRVVK